MEKDNNIKELTMKELNEKLNELMSLKNADIYGRVISCSENDDEMVMNLITNLPDLTTNYIYNVKEAYDNRRTDLGPWLMYKVAFVEYLIIAKAANSYAIGSNKEERQRTIA